MTEQNPQLTTVKEHSDFCYGCAEHKETNRRTRKPCTGTVNGKHVYFRRYEVDLKQLFGGKS